MGGGSVLGSPTLEIGCLIVSYKIPITMQTKFLFLQLHVLGMFVLWVGGLLLVTYAILHAFWTPSPPFLHVIRIGNV